MFRRTREGRLQRCLWQKALIEGRDNDRGSVDPRFGQICFSFPGVRHELSELFAMGPVQLRCPCGVAENSFTKPGFWEHLVDFSQEKTAKHRVH